VQVEFSFAGLPAEGADCGEPGKGLDELRAEHHQNIRGAYRIKTIAY
jgi:hypothetical protein